MSSESDSDVQNGIICPHSPEEVSIMLPQITGCVTKFLHIIMKYFGQLSNLILIHDRYLIQILHRTTGGKRMNVQPIPGPYYGLYLSGGSFVDISTYPNPTTFHRSRSNINTIKYISPGFYIDLQIVSIGK